MTNVFLDTKLVTLWQRTVVTLWEHLFINVRCAANVIRLYSHFKHTRGKVIHF